MAKDGTIHWLMHAVADSLGSLNAKVEVQKLEEISVMLFRSLMRKERLFHSIRHVSELSEDGRAHFTLAALFHDQVYYQVDLGFTDEVLNILDPYIETKVSEASPLGEIYLRKDLPEDPISQLNLSIF